MLTIDQLHPKINRANVPTILYTLPALAILIRQGYYGPTKLLMLGSCNEDYRN
jgi:hypothetical protein